MIPAQAMDPRNNPAARIFHAPLIVFISLSMLYFPFFRGPCFVSDPSAYLSAAVLRRVCFSYFFLCFFRSSFFGFLRFLFLSTTPLLYPREPKLFQLQTCHKSQRGGGHGGGGGRDVGCDTQVKSSSYSPQCSPHKYKIAPL
jgi:hypothetical protein